MQFIELIRNQNKHGSFVIEFCERRFNSSTVHSMGCTLRCSSAPNDPNQRKRANHNETEKRRIKTMNNSIEELRTILTVRTGRKPEE